MRRAALAITFVFAACRPTPEHHRVAPSASVSAAEAKEAPGEEQAHDRTPALDPPAPRARTSIAVGAPLPAALSSEPDEPIRAGEPGCGSVVVDGARVPLECDDDALGAITKGAAEDVVPRAELQPDEKLAGAMKLPPLVDHRQDKTEGPVRSQGATSACTAFSLASAIDHALLRHLGKAALAVSSLHIWARYHKLDSALAIDQNLGHPIARETDWPFDAKLACSWEPGKKDCTIGGEHIHRGQSPDPALLAKADDKPYARIQHVTRIEAPSSTVLKQILAKGQDVWLGMSIGDGPFRKVTAANPVIADYDPKKAKGGHRFLLAGYRVQDNGTYFLVHNSWGAKWADGGYAWMHDKTLAAVKSAVIVDAIPTEGAHLPPAPTASPRASCGKDEAADTVTHACAPTCPDGSPRFDRICASTKDCDAGEVNLSGACVAAAPTTRGASKNGVAFDCHPGGCVYTLPKGTAGCTHASCHTCPAPRFFLVKGAKGLSCSE